MTSLAGAPAAFRRYGLRVQLAPDWLGHDHGPLGTIQTIVWHHTAGASTGNYPSYSVVRDGRAGLPGPLAQFGLTRNGSVICFSGGLAYHAGVVRNGTQDNFNAIGFEAESTGYGDWTDAQIIAYPRAAAALCDLFDLPSSRNLAHYEICSPPGRKIDAAELPGGMPEQRRRVAALLKNGGSDMPLNSADKDFIRRTVRQEAHNGVWIDAKMRLADSPRKKDGSFHLEPAWITLSYLISRLRNYMNADRKVLYAAVTRSTATVLKAVDATVTEEQARAIVDQAANEVLAELEEHRQAIEAEAAQAAADTTAA